MSVEKAGVKKGAAARGRAVSGIASETCCRFKQRAMIRIHAIRSQARSIMTSEAEFSIADGANTAITTGRAGMVVRDHATGVDSSGGQASGATACTA